MSRSLTTSKRWFSFVGFWVTSAWKEKTRPTPVYQIDAQNRFSIEKFYRPFQYIDVNVITTWVLLKGSKLPISNSGLSKVRCMSGFFCLNYIILKRYGKSTTYITRREPDYVCYKCENKKGRNFKISKIMKTSPYIFPDFSQLFIKLQQ